MTWERDLTFLDLFKTEKIFFVNNKFACNEGIGFVSYPILSYPILSRQLSKLFQYITSFYLRSHSLIAKFHSQNSLKKISFLSVSLTTHRGF